MASLRWERAAMMLTMIAWIGMAVSVCYVPFRLKNLLGLRRRWPLAVLTAAVLGGYLLLLHTGIYVLDNIAIAWIYNALGLLFVFVIYLFFLLLITHPLTALLKRIPKRPLGLGGILVSAFLVALGFVNAQSFSVTRHDVAVKGLTQAVRIVHLPDLHLGAQRGEAYLHRILDAIDEQKPDMVLYNGDLVDSNIALKPELFSLFKRVRAEQYFTTGNHEYYLDTDRALRLIAGAGIRILRSEMVETRGIQLIGMEYMNADRETYDAHMVNTLTLKEELPRIARDGGKPSVLVHHSPVGTRYVADGHIDLMLAGHTHGGQLFPGTALVKYRFPMYRGRHQLDGLTLLVSQGAGTFGPWMRLGTRNELQVVQLIPAISNQ
ncbi:MAG: metallophosphoesterase [Candidatus Accumulibacter sp.]|jgi:predicted MPP superfamily phosphohydrolase|nr:metallophosphoesterase [Accumulibacter sp.]